MTVTHTYQSATVDDAGKEVSSGEWNAAHAITGTDLWVYVVKTGTFTTTTAAAVNVTSLSFIPAKNVTYEIEGQLWLTTTTVTIGARPGLAWPTSVASAIAYLQVASSATALVIANGNQAAALLAANTGLPTTTGPWPAQFQATMTTGANTTGPFWVQLATETANGTVAMIAGSFLKYRTIP